MQYRIQMFDDRNEWTTYGGMVRDTPDPLISEAREWWETYGPEAYPGGLRVVDAADRVVWSIGTEPAAPADALTLRFSH